MQEHELLVISHTHWDREWYQSFQDFRYRLVRMMDDLIKVLEKESEFRMFHLDGQTIVLEDYLEIRPENKARLQSLIREGRIAIGPWYVMPDEFLISGEALIKNLQVGHEICAQYGVKPMSNGYVTDIFGHNSQFPQLLAGFNIASATLYRGIGDYPKDAFRWRSPDGSEVVAAKLDPQRCYSNFYFAIRWPYEKSGFDPEDAVRRMKELFEYSKKRAATDKILMMDGVDHIGIDPEVPAMLRLFEERIPGIKFKHASLEEYFDGIKTEELDVIEGALYTIAKEGVNNQLLKNVLSSVVYLKQQNDLCETTLSSYAQPLDAFTELFSADLDCFSQNNYSLSPRRVYLDKAWNYLLQNQAHDSICGCSVGDVHRDNEYRFRQARQMADIAATDCLGQVTRNIRCLQDYQDTMILYNPSQLPVSGPAQIELVVSAPFSADFRFYDDSGDEIVVQILDYKDEIDCSNGVRQAAEFVNKIRLTAVASLHIPAFGYTTIHCSRRPVGQVNTQSKSYTVENFCPPKRLAGTMFTRHNQIDNGRLLIMIKGNGTLDVSCKKSGKVYENLLLFEDCGDQGDGWNYRKPFFDSLAYSGENCRISIESDGPLACVLKFTHRIRIQESIGDFSRSDDTVEQQIDTWVTVLKDSDGIQFHTSMENVAEGYRLRVLFPTDLDTDVFYTKTPFDMQKWGVVFPDTSTYVEKETKVYPSQGVTYIADSESSLSVFGKGLYEVEVINNPQKAVALTLMRSAMVEYGSAFPTEIKVKRPLTFDYAVSFGKDSPTESLLAGEQFRTPVLTQAFIPNPKAMALLPEQSFIQIQSDGKIVSMITHGAFGQCTNGTAIRLYDVSGREEAVTITLAQKIEKAFLINFKGDILEELTANGHTVSVSCGPHKISTVLIQIK